MTGGPLAGRRVLVTRPDGQGERLAALLRKRGAEVERLPTIRITDLEDHGPLLQAAARLCEYDWAVLTSVNGVERLAAALQERGIDVGACPGVRWAAIGPATARALHRIGVAVVLLPASYRAESLAEAIREGGSEEDSTGAPPLAGRRVLLARAAEARSVLPDRLRADGAVVEEVAAYVTEPNHEVAAALRAATRAGGLDWITFTASSAVRAFCELGGEVGDSRVAVIGPITAQTARDLDVPVHAVASRYTISGLVGAIVQAEGRTLGVGRGVR
jgi:uroporphyrinogen III methyltransferase/synthase